MADWSVFVGKEISHVDDSSDRLINISFKSDNTINDIKHNQKLQLHAMSACYDKSYFSYKSPISEIVNKKFESINSYYDSQIQNHRWEINFTDNTKFEFYVLNPSLYYSGWLKASIT